MKDREIAQGQYDNGVCYVRDRVGTLSFIPTRI